ncbi:MAG: HNH endonuclease [Verrucomicrobiia bacterium]
MPHTRLITTHVKVEVWQRDGGKCVECGRTDNLHYDHDIPFSKGGSSLTAENVRLFCAKHNLSKSDKIMSVLPWVGVGTMAARVVSCN